MEFRKVVGWAKGHRNVLVVTAFILVLAGVDLLVNRPKGDVEWFSIPLLAIGLVILALVFWPAAKPGPRAPGDTLAHRFLWRATWQGRLIPLFPVFGVAIIVADIVYNLYLSPTPAFLEHDQAALLAGMMLVAYRFVPERYGRERDFVFLFSFVLCVILVLPLLLLRTFGNVNASVDAYSWVALAPETSAVLNLIGIPSTVGPDPRGSTAPGLTFTTEGGLVATVVITSACSGIYSFAIFASAFTAFVMTEQKRFTARVATFFALGVLLAYVANILRMVAIVIIGYKYDTPANGVQNMLVAHSNAGWIIFLAWIALFWIMLFRFLPREEPPRESQAKAKGAPRRGVFCGICGIVLTPAIPATQCPCGRLYHVECLSTEGQCPNCSAPSPNAPVDHASA